MSYFNFDGLPQELKTRIFHIAHLADERFRERHTSLELPSTPRAPDPPGSNAQRLREYHGRTIAALSSVNKECRLLSGKWMFRFVEMEKMNEVLFQHHIFGSKFTGDWITTISFEETQDFTTVNLTFAFIFILPHLPRLERIVNLKSRTTQLLFGEKGLATKHRGARLSTETQEQRLVLHKFLQIATRIKHWIVELTAEEVEVIVLNSPNSILSLDLLSPPLSGSPLLETSDSRFPSILRRLTSLAALYIASSRCLDDPSRDKFPFVHSSALALSYPFVTSLTSLTLTTDSFSINRVDNTAMQLAVQFQHLQHLRIESFNFTFSAQARGHEQEEKEDEELDYHFPNLLHLELMGSTIYRLDSLLYRLILPKVRTIRLQYFTWYDQRMQDREEALDLDDSKIEYVREGLSRFPSTLKHVYLRSQYGLYRSSLEERVKPVEEEHRDGIVPYTFHLDDEKQLGEAELDVSDGKARVDGNYVWKKVKTKLKNEELLDSIVTSTMELLYELAVWMLEQVDAVKESEDIPQAKQLLRTMKLASDFKKWMED